ncbi:MAG: hypothetical protein ACPGQS_04310 [Bradymonadia bacterium]
MRSKILSGTILIGLTALFGCLSENESLDRCEPCLAGFSCVETPFGTYDCLPDEVEQRGTTDGTMFQFDMSGPLPPDAGPLVNGRNDLGMDPTSDASLPEPVYDAEMASVDALLPDEVDGSAAVEDSLPLPSRAGRAAAGRLTRLDIPTNVMSARAGGCSVVGENAGSGLSGVLTILGTTITEQLTSNQAGEIPLVLLADFPQWTPGLTAHEHGSGTLEFFTGIQQTNGSFIIEDSVDSSTSMDRLPTRFDVEFSGTDFTTEIGRFRLETSTFDLPFFVQLDHASVTGRVDVTDAGVAMVETTLNGYLSFSSVRQLVMTIQQSCNAQPSESFCAAANRFLDGDPSTPELDGDTAQIARMVILPLMRNLDVRLTQAGPIPCDPFCETDECVRCNAVSVCGLVETTPASVEE